MVRRAGLVAIAVANLILLVAGCATTGGRDIAADEAAVRAVLDTYAESVNKNDVEQHASIWDDAGIKDKPNAPTVVGLKALKERWLKSWGTSTSRMAITINQLVVSGDLAVAHGVYTNESVPKDGGKTVYTDGKFLTVFRRQPDGTWKIYADASSSNVP